MPGAKCRGDQGPLPMAVRRTHLISPAASCDGNVSGPPPGKLIRGSRFRVFIGGRSQRHLLLACIQFLTPEKKRKPHCWHSLGPTNPSSQFWEWWGPSPNPRSLLPAQGPSCKQTFQLEVSGQTCSLFLHRRPQLCYSGDIRYHCWAYGILSCVVLTSKSLVWWWALL